MRIETDRLIITELTMDMAEDIHRNSLDEDTRRFVPDEVFETPEEARETVQFLISRYGSPEGPLVYALLTKEAGQNIGYVQMVPIGEGKWEIGYHIGKQYTCFGYATEAVRAFLPLMAEKLGLQEVTGICLKDNTASCRVMEKSGFTEAFRGAGEYQGQEREIARYVWKKTERTGCRIMAATAADTDAVLQLYREEIGRPFCFWDEDYPGPDTVAFDLSRDALFVMKDEKGEIIAAISIEEDEDVNRLTCWDPSLQPGSEYARLAVRPACQGRGIGGQMVSHILGVLKERGFKSIHIIVNRDNLPAIRTYAHFGFCQAGECDMYGQHFLCYEKELD